MRTIEKKMLNAIAKLQDSYGCKVIRLGNTRVESDHIGGVHVYLHGNRIAIKHRNEPWQINLCGWDTATTRSRINAILSTIESGYRVFRRKGKLMIGGACGQMGIDDNAWIDV